MFTKGKFVDLQVSMLSRDSTQGRDKQSHLAEIFKYLLLLHLQTTVVRRFL